MFKKILIANRGEIACRVATTARRLGVRTVAVYSDADAGARHVALCDEAVHIGSAPARDSYLRGDRILAAARATGAEGIHPGYGFLSENEAFAQACGAAGIAFIGPPDGAIRAMGSKSEAKTLMEKAGVPLVPGYHGAEQDGAFLRAQADAIGYPVLIKASAGGGGKGMRVVRAGDEFEAALVSCKREAASSFGDDRVLVEKYLERPRHIEIQVFADAHGGCVYLFERDCSVQRRHQKIIEEAHAPGLGREQLAPLLDRIGQTLSTLGYDSLGTVEMLLAPDGEFRFLEMNTRLQVEHGVTEQITGVDLVQAQVRCAAGEQLGAVLPEQIRSEGHAIQARVYAEDPKRFLPSPGTLTAFVPPAAPHIRVETGYRAGMDVTPHYDPLLAKVIAWAPTRAQAIERLCGALGEFAIAGLKHNIPALLQILASEEFQRGDVHTGLAMQVVSRQAAKAA